MKKLMSGKEPRRRNAKSRGSRSPSKYVTEETGGEEGECLTGMRRYPQGRCNLDFSTNIVVSSGWGRVPMKMLEA